MLFSSTYKEIKNPVKGEYKEKGSKFIGYAFPVYSELEVKKKIQKVKKIEHAAQHHCYSFVLYTDKSASRVNDDGEPSSTAGRPILGIINTNNLTNILIIVARYFGGVKLGIPGLIRSYKETAYNTIQNGIIITKEIKEIYEVSFNYVEMNYIMTIIKKYKVEIIETKNLKENCKIIFAVKKDKSDMFIKSLKMNHKLHVKYIKTI